MQKLVTYFIAATTLLTMGFGIIQRVHAEDYSPETVEEQPVEEHETTTVTGVQVHDPTLYEKLDKMQESLDALTAALAPSDDAEIESDEVSEQTPEIDYSAQLSAISAQLDHLNEVATAETAEPSAFEKPFADYSTSETLALVLVAAVMLLAFTSIIKNFIL